MTKRKGPPQPPEPQPPEPQPPEPPRAFPERPTPAKPPDPITPTPSEDAGKVPDADDDRRPTPVRMVMETEEEPEAPPVGPEYIRSFRDPDSGEAWLAEVTGWSMSGVLPLRTVPLLEVVFKPEGSTEPPVKRIVHQGESLAAFTEAEMVALFSRAEPYREPSLKPGQEGGTSRKKRKRQNRS